MKLRKMIPDDKMEVLSMMRVFYHSPAVLHHAEDAILERDFKDCTGDCPFVEGYIVEVEEKTQISAEPANRINVQTAGYAMLAKSYSTEYACICIWIEDLYFKPAYRAMGLGTAFFKELEKLYPASPVRFRLEAEPENVAAIGLYQKMGFQELPYLQMTKEIE